MTQYSEILDSYDSIHLGEMDNVRLMNRMDQKYLFSTFRLPEILSACSSEYRVLTICGSRSCRYETRYYDTGNMEMYTRHHNGKQNRHKVRFRTYLDTGLSFFEIKFKNNKGRTIKDRIKVKGETGRIEGDLEWLLENKTSYTREMLQEAIKVYYNRITLVHKSLPERITIDTCLNFQTSSNACGYPGLVIAEIKQDKSSRSPFIRLMQDHFIPPYTISKYCLGVASLHPGVKINNFKPKLLHVNKICHHSADSIATNLLQPGL